MNGSNWDLERPNLKCNSCVLIFQSLNRNPISSYDGWIHSSTFVSSSSPLHSAKREKEISKAAAVLLLSLFILFYIQARVV